EKDRRAKQIAASGKGRIEPERPGRGVRGLASVVAGDEIDGRVDRDSRGDFAGIAAAHTVGYDAEAQPLVNREAVLIGRPDPALVGDSVRPQHPTPLKGRV